jgi:hypothetical protein
MCKKTGKGPGDGYKNGKVNVEGMDCGSGVGKRGMSMKKGRPRGGLKCF